MAKAIKLVILSCVLSICLLDDVSCRRLANQKESSITTEQSEIDDGDAEGASRANYGWPATPPPWLGAVWDSENKDGFGDHGKHAGSAIHLGDGHMITHFDTTNLLNNRELVDNIDTAAYQPAQLSVPLDKTINVRDGSKYAPIRMRGDRTTVVQNQLGGSPFDLHKISPMPRANVSTSLAKSSLKNLQRPNLEHDVSQFGSDCHAYAWSTNPNLGNGPYSSRASHPDQRHFVKFPVDKVKCEGVKCLFSSENTGTSAICTGVGDHGAPILCGPQKKLTYLVAGISGESTACTGKFDAYHVPHMVKSIKDRGLSHIL